MQIEGATHEDFLQILRDLPDFWGTSGPALRTLPYHYPFLVHEFADTAFVIRSGSTVIAEGLNSKIPADQPPRLRAHSATAVIAMIYLCCGGITVQLPTER